MTPEELNRTVEFIIQSQARLAAGQEQDRIDRLQSEKELKAFDRRLAGLLEIQVQLLESQSRRLDNHENGMRAAEKRHQEAEKRHQEALAEMREESRQFRQESVEFHREFRERMDDWHVWQERFLADVQKKHDET